MISYFQILWLKFYAHLLYFPARKADNLTSVCEPRRSQTYGPSRPVTGVAYLLSFTFLLHARHFIMHAKLTAHIFLPELITTQEPDEDSNEVPHEAIIIHVSSTSFSLLLQHLPS
jgi:hypothetical protein